MMSSPVSFSELAGRVAACAGLGDQLAELAEGLLLAPNLASAPQLADVADAMSALVLRTAPPAATTPIAATDGARAGVLDEPPGMSTRRATNAAAAAAIAQAEKHQAIRVAQDELAAVTDGSFLAEKSARTLLERWASKSVDKKQLGAEDTSQTVLHSRVQAFSTLVKLAPDAGEAAEASALVAWWGSKPREELLHLLTIGSLRTLVNSLRDDVCAEALLAHEKKQLIKMVTSPTYTPTKRGKKRRADDADGNDGDDEGGGSEVDEEAQDEEMEANVALAPAAPLFDSPQDAKGLAKADSSKARRMIARLLAEVECLSNLGRDGGIRVGMIVRLPAPQGKQRGGTVGVALQNRLFLSGSTIDDFRPLMGSFLDAAEPRCAATASKPWGIAVVGPFGGTGTLEEHFATEGKKAATSKLRSSAAEDGTPAGRSALGERTNVVETAPPALHAAASMQAGDGSALGFLGESQPSQ